MLSFKMCNIFFVHKRTLANKICASKLSPFLFFPCMPLHEVDLLYAFVVAVADNEVWLLYFAMDGVKYGLI